MAETCSKYNPLPDDAAYCTCNLHWDYHSQNARNLFWDKTSQDRIDLVIAATKRPKCGKYVPSKDWPEGDPLPACVCGRPARPSHLVHELLDGRRAFRAAHPVKKALSDPCGSFHGTLTIPGTCCVCQRKWIDHAPWARGLVIESYFDAHESWCKCIIMNGDIECSCLSEHEIQDALDKIGQVKKEPLTMGCKEFKPKSTGNTHCQCGAAFHMHTTIATDGHASFMSWRTAHLSNKEILQWFMLLGKTKEIRITTLKRILEDPHFTFVPPANIVTPSDVTILALLDALTGSHHIQSPTDIEKIEAKRNGDSILDTKLDEEFFHNCYSCGESKSLIKGQMCDDCEQVHHPKSGPALVHTAGELNG